MLVINRLSPRPNGFTAIELLVTIAVAAILMAIAVPSLTQIVRNSELTSITNTLLASINGARSEAMKRGGFAMVVPRGNGSGGTWNNGWVVFVDVKTNNSNNSNNYAYQSGNDDNNDVLVFLEEQLPSYFSIEGDNTANDNPAYIMFDPSGYSKTKIGGFGDVTLTLSRNDATGSPAAKCREVRSIVIEKTGRARSCTPTSNNDTACRVVGAPCS
jgi:type IV fimbrial biogenesis protein FimT